MKRKLTRYARVVLFALVGVAILWYITRVQDVDRIWQELVGANFLWVILSIVAGVVSHVLRALRWNLLIRSMDQPVRFSTTFYALMTGYLANMAVPRMGEVTRCATLSKYSGAPFNVLAGTVIAERFFDMLSLLTLIFLTIAFQFTFLKEFLEYYIFTPLAEIARGKTWMLLMAGLVFLVALWAFWQYMRRVSAEKSGLASRIKRQATGLWRGMTSLALVRQKMLFLFYTVFIWLFYFLTVYLCFFALEATSVLGVKDGFTLLALGSLGIAAPVPGGVGTYHFIVITTLTELFNIASEPATSYAYIAHASQIVLVLVVGAFAWMMLSLKLKNNVQHEQPATNPREFV